MAIKLNGIVQLPSCFPQSTVMYNRNHSSLGATDGMWSQQARACYTPVQSGQGSVQDCSSWGGTTHIQTQGCLLEASSGLGRTGPMGAYTCQTWTAGEKTVFLSKRSKHLILCTVGGITLRRTLFRLLQSNFKCISQVKNFLSFQSLTKSFKRWLHKSYMQSSNRYKHKNWLASQNKNIFCPTIML